LTDSLITFNANKVHKVFYEHNLKPLVHMTVTESVDIWIPEG